MEHKDEIPIEEFLYGLTPNLDDNNGGTRYREEINVHQPEPGPVTIKKMDGTVVETRPMNDAEMKAWRKAERNAR